MRYIAIAALWSVLANGLAKTHQKYIDFEPIGSYSITDTMDVGIHSNAEVLSPSDSGSKKCHFWSHSFDLAHFLDCLWNVSIVVINEILCCLFEVPTRV